MRLCIAGTNSILVEDRDLVNEIPFVLESFIYIKKWQYPIIKNAKMFLLDSGAFTFMFSYKKEITEKVLNDYLDEYIKFINEQDVKYFFNLDLDTIIGIEKTRELRRKLERKTGKKCIPVWHKCMGLNSWIELTKEYDYVAIGTIKDWQSNYKALRKLNKIAKKNNCKVHGLGYTKNDALQLGFYSVDSTSWLAGGRFGMIYELKKGKLQRIKYANKRLKDYREANRYNLKVWIQYQKYLDRGE